MIAYKLFRVMKNGEIASLFIDKKARYKTGVWMNAKNVPTKGYANRQGWHSTNKPFAPHLSLKDRKWFKVEIKDYKKINRPISQGGVWYISNHLKILKQI